MKNLYLWLAVIGAVVPYVFFVQHFAEAGLSPLGLVAAAFENPGASGFAADVIISSVVFLQYVFEKGDRRAWLLLAVNLLIGLSCALPLYLYLRSRDAAVAASRGREAAPTGAR